MTPDEQSSGFLFCDNRQSKKTLGNENVARRFCVVKELVRRMIFKPIAE